MATLLSKGITSSARLCERAATKPRFYAQRFKSEPIIPTAANPEGFRAYDQSVSKQSSQTTDGRLDPFKQIHHERARTKNDFEEWRSDPDEFKMKPWKAIIPLLCIGGGIAIIISGIIAHPPGDDDDDD